jgi:hypothetical protein
MNLEIKVEGIEQLMKQVAANAAAEGQPLSELEQRCLRIALQDHTHAGLKEIEKEFPSPEAYNDFVGRAQLLIEQAVLHEAESHPEMTPQARAALEKFLTGKGGAVVGSAISMALFGKMPGVMKAFGVAALVVPLAAIVGWQVYADLASGRVAASSRFPLQAILGLAVLAAVSSIVNLLKELSGK